MKTITVKPVLVESNEPTNLLINTINGRLLFDCQDVIKIHAKHQQLILIGITCKERIVIGDRFYCVEENNLSVGLYICDNDNVYCANCLDVCHKVIATQDQIPESYIQQFISEYNGGVVNDVVIEMVETFCVSGGLRPIGELGGKGLQHHNHSFPKLTDGFITIVENELKRGVTFNGISDPIELAAEMYEQLSSVKSDKIAFCRGAKSKEAKEFHSKDLYTKDDIYAIFNGDFKLYLDEYFKQNKK